MVPSCLCPQMSCLELYSALKILKLVFVHLFVLETGRFHIFKKIYILPFYKKLRLDLTEVLVEVHTGYFYEWPLHQCPRY